MFYIFYLLLKLLYFQKYEVMTMSVVGGQPKKHANQAVIKLKKKNESTLLICNHNKFRWW